jgi:diguanylate cyclase (GGDEF)-like protein
VSDTSRPGSLAARLLATRRVLVVEDDPDIRFLLEQLLAGEHDVILAGDGETGVQLAFDELPDAVLMDLFLPRMDGFAALRAIKAEPRTADIPVLFISSQRDDSTRVRGLDLGADDFLAKPFSASELRARIDRALRSARQRQHLQTLAQTDALTGLANYRAFRARLEEEIERSRRYGGPLAAIMIDLDDLKPINDELGHATGNRALVELASAIRAELRVTDFAARYGGDEFVVLLPHTGPDEARALAERLRRALALVDLGRRGLLLRASFGVSARPGGAEMSAESLIGAADEALYRAKRAGRDRVCVAGDGGGPPVHA